MKKLLILLLVLCLKANAQNNAPVQLPVYPSFTQMATEFFQHYTLAEAYPKEYYFAKKPNGWHILLVDRNNKYGDRQVIEDYLFWDRSKKSYLPLTLPKNESAEVAKIPFAYDTWDNKYFGSISPYFGYAGWDADVIKDYGILQNLSDTLLNALARAYTSYAANLLSNNTGLSDSKVRFDLKPVLNSLSPEQLETYRKYEHLGIETYKKLWKLNPKFENFVGDIYLVYSNEIMNSFLTLRYFQNEAEAKKELDQPLYDPFYVATAKNYLSSCDPNAILFTNGDSDTFPLLYVQAKEGFRTDVLVVNICLLGTGRYMNHLFYKIGQSKPLSVSLDKNLYINDSKQIVCVIEKTKGPTEVKELIKFIGSSDTAAKYNYGTEYWDYVTPDLKINVNKDNVLHKKIVAQSESDKIEPLMEWNLGKRQYINQNDLAILDILSSSNFQRPVYFAITVSDELYLGLELYFQLEGLAYKIVPIKSEINKSEYIYGRINTDDLYNKLKNDFFYANLNDVYISEAHRRMISNFRMQYARLASILIDEKKPDKAEDILDFCFQKYPTAVIPADYFCIQQVKCYYKLMNFNKANLLVTEIFKKYAGELDIQLKQKSPRTEDAQYKIRLGLVALNELSTLTTQNNQGKLGESIKKKYDSCYKILFSE